MQLREGEGSTGWVLASIASHYPKMVLAKLRLLGGIGIATGIVALLIQSHYGNQNVCVYIYIYMHMHIDMECPKIRRYNPRGDPI